MPKTLPVAVTLEKADGSIAVVARFTTIAEAEAYLAGPGIDQVSLAAGDYGIDAPEEMVNPRLREFDANHQSGGLMFEQMARSHAAEVADIRQRHPATRGMTDAAVYGLFIHPKR